jgi:hypothetical protein
MGGFEKTKNEYMKDSMTNSKNVVSKKRDPSFVFDVMPMFLPTIAWIFYIVVW